MSRQPLSRDRVLEAAIRVADRGGAEAITMRRVAQELNVEAMSLYHHVPNKDTMIDGVVDVVFTAIDPPVTDEEWRPQIRNRAATAREVLTRHRWALALLDSRYRPGPAMLKRHNAFLGILRNAGFSVPMAIHGISLIDSYVNGYVLYEANLPRDPGEAADGLVEHVAELPHLREVVEHVVQGYDTSDEFEYGLDLILDGLEARR